MSDNFGILKACGSISYELLDSYGNAAPAIATIVYTDGDPTLNVDINAKDFDEDAPQ